MSKYQNRITWKNCKSENKTVFFKMSVCLELIFLHKKFNLLYSATLTSLPSKQSINQLKTQYNKSCTQRLNTSCFVLISGRAHRASNLSVRNSGANSSNLTFAEQNDDGAFVTGGLRWLSIWRPVLRLLSTDWWNPPFVGQAEFLKFFET